jgi:hypothetical protein
MVGSFDWELASMRPLSSVELMSQRLGICFLLSANTSNRCASFSDGKKTFRVVGERKRIYDWLKAYFTDTNQSDCNFIVEISYITLIKMMI